VVAIEDYTSSAEAAGLVVAAVGARSGADLGAHLD